MKPKRLYASVTPRTLRRVQELAAAEHVSDSRMTATLIREALDARGAEAERIRREFELRPSWPVSA